MRAVYAAGYSAAAPSEIGVLCQGHRVPDATKRPLIVSGGYGAVPEWAVIEPRVGAQAFVESGRAAFGGDFAGTATFGNDACQARITDGVAYVRAQLPCAQDKVLLVGQSGGGADVLNWAISHLSQVAAIALCHPAIDLADIHDHNRAFAPHPGGFAVDIETAYGGAAGWTAAEPTHNPVRGAAAIAAAGVPVFIQYSADDPICLASIAQSFATAVGAETLNVGNANHGFGTMDRGRVHQFLRTHA